MFYHPDWIIYLWLTPVFITFVFPLLVMPSGWFLKFFMKIPNKGVMARESPSFVIDKPEVQLPGSDKRKHPRQKVVGVVAHVSDGINYCEGLLTDVSKFGLCLQNRADKLDRKAEKLGILLVGNGKYFQVQVKPKWERGDALEESVGAEIEDAYWDWEEFRENIEGVKQFTHAQA